MGQSPFKKFSSLLLSVCLLSLGAQNAFAEDTLRNENDTLWLSAGTGFFNYKEPSAAPDLPDSEHGWIPAVGLGVTWMLPDTRTGFDKNLFLSLDGTGEFGSANYNGAFYNDPTIALKGRTQETIFDINSQIGRGFELGTFAMFIPYLEFGYHFWDRDLGEGQVEDYHHYDTLGGLKLQVSPISGLLLAAYGSVGTTLGPAMKTAGVSYDLGDNAIVKIGGKVGYDITRRLQLFTTLDFDHFRYGQSPVIQGVYEPTSATEDTVWRVGLGYHFN